MITVVEFRAKQATGSRYIPIDKLYTNFHRNWVGLIGARQKLGAILENRMLQKWK